MDDDNADSKPSKSGPPEWPPVPEPLDGYD